MSAGRSMRRGYYGIGPSIPSMSTPEHDLTGTLWVALLVVITLFMLLLQSDRVFAASMGAMLGELWSEASGFVLYVLGR